MFEAELNSTINICAAGRDSVRATRILSES